MLFSATEAPTDRLPVVPFPPIPTAMEIPPATELIVDSSIEVTLTPLLPVVVTELLFRIDATPSLRMLLIVTAPAPAMAALLPVPAPFAPAMAPPMAYALMLALEWARTSIVPPLARVVEITASSTQAATELSILLKANAAPPAPAIAPESFALLRPIATPPATEKIDDLASSATTDTLPAEMACEPSSEMEALISAAIELMATPTARARPFGLAVGSLSGTLAITTAIPAATAVMLALFVASTARAPVMPAPVLLKWASTVSVMVL